MNNHKWKATNSVLFIIFLTFIFLVISLKVQDIGISLAIAELDSKYISKQMELNEKLIRENQELRDKLENSEKIQVPEATKNVVRYYLQKYFGDKADEAEKIFKCESGLSPTSLHINRAGLGADYGVAQLSSKYQKANFEKFIGIPFEIGAYDIEMNLRFAAHLHKEQGFQPWVCSRLI